MSIIDPIIREYQNEASVTRRLLERAPDAKFDWKPHQRSMTLGQLVSHLAEIPGFAVPILDLDEFNLDPTRTRYAARSGQDLLATYDKNVSQALGKMTGQGDEALRKPWKMLLAGKPLMELPRVAALRVLLVSHSIHHRGQLSVYLRLLDVKVPAIYGPSADEAV